ncbi:hypothetical protein BU16DRAFT_621084 [Lophium mytilinum]|uniref:Gfd2/YDR514C-like C-terminal domain-containing protein n=1 Tax=Lophium mytilinum TaxID=390894 RepID=A0A6A6QGJ3_9PEZI|nr:hypothetical protein BU16DRAFT_621084 [Lophium mytilinum]
MTTISATQGSFPTDISEIRSRLRSWNQVKTMRWALGNGSESAENQPSSAILIAIDCEWHENEPRELTEIGIAMLDTRDIQGLEPGPNAENWLDKIWFYHLRIREHGHMLNTRFCPGHPDDFNWGTTKWVTKAEASRALHDLFTERVEPPKPELCPVVFLGHAVHGDSQKLAEHLQFDMGAIGSVVSTLDTQVIANECGYRGRGDTIGLGPLCSRFDISPKHLHNAGNDSGYTLITAVMMGLTSEQKELAKVDKPVDSLMTSLMAARKSYRPPSWGVESFCTRCDRVGHVQPQCRARVECSKCKAKSRRGYRSHSTHRCTRVERVYESMDEFNNIQW